MDILSKRSGPAPWCAAALLLAAACAAPEPADAPRGAEGAAPAGDAPAAAVSPDAGAGAPAAPHPLGAPVDQAPAGALPAGHPALPGSDLDLAPPEGSGRGAAGLAWDAPAGWRAVEPATPMRRAQWAVDGPGGEAECVVFYFGPGQGGDALANARRWAEQFTQPDGRSSLEVATLTRGQVGDLAVMYVEVTGTYMGGITFGGPPPEPRPDHMLMGAIVEGPDANWFFKFTGPAATVASQAEAFQSLISSLRTGA
ncbi:MAG: hypothetical protein D6701_09225 [Gemmatimonadetes bacterium]|nr:MAG: hypothetical protein D6701_09225 [Gemmatimonadota bacterium]